MRGRRRSNNHHIELRIVVPAALLPGARVGGVVVPVGTGIDAELGPDEQAARHAAAEQRVVGERVVVRAGRVPREPVGRVAGLRDLVGIVRRRRLDGVDQRLVEEELREVRHLPAAVRPVVEHLGAHVRDDVLVRRTPRVVPREQRVEVDDAVAVRRLHAPQVRRPEAALARGADAAVDALGVAVREFSRLVK